MTLVAQIVNFIILLLLLTKLAYKPLLKAMAERRARIANDLEAAEKERQAAEQLRQEYQQQMQEARGGGVLDAMHQPHAGVAIQRLPGFAVRRRNALA